MNPKHRMFAVLVLSFAALPGLGAQTVIDQLFGLRSYELADAYWTVGQKFTALGQADRGAQFQARAKHLFPGFVPGQAPAFTALPATAPAPEPKVPEASIVREKNLQGEKIARLQFQKLLRGYLTGSASTITSVLGQSLEIQGQSVVPTTETVTAFLEAHPTEAGAPEDLFRTETLDLTDGPNQQVLVTIASNPDAGTDLPTLFPFWKSSQVYTFDRVGDTWKLIRIEGK